LEAVPRVASTVSLWLKFWRIAAAAATIAAVIFISVAPQVSNDFWLQAKVGELIAQNHAIPKTILFPFTWIRDAPFNAHEWLPSLLFYWLINTVGEGGLPFVLGFAGLALFFLMTWLAYRRSEQSLPVAMLLGLLAVGVENYRHLLRPELVSLFLLGFYWHLLESCRRRPHVLIWMSALLVVVLWANTHGSFILAPIIAMVYAAGLWADGKLAVDAWNESQKAKVKAFAIFSVATLAVALINPVGVELLEFVFDFSRSDAAKVLVTEWLPTFTPRFREAPGFWIGLGCAGATAAVMLIRWRKLSAVDALLFLMFLALALQTIRFLVYLGMVAAYVVPALLPSGWQTAKNRTRAYAICTGVSGLVLGLAIQFGNAYGAYPYKAWGTDSSLFDDMVKQLNDPKLQGNVINSYALGAELVYRAYPRLRPSIDSRVDSYGGAYTVLNDRLFLEDELLTEFVKDYDVRYMLLTQRDFHLLEKLPNWTEKRWSVRAMDRNTVLLERADLLGKTQ
jgi:hypothetical protein